MCEHTNVVMANEYICVNTQMYSLAMTTFVCSHKRLEYKYAGPSFSLLAAFFNLFASDEASWLTGLTLMLSNTVDADEPSDL